MNRRIFLVAGMHRSGTSFLSQTLSRLGLELPESIMPPQPCNPKGFFESLKIVEEHDKILNTLEMQWHTTMSIPEGWYSSEYAVKSEKILTELIQSEYSGHGPIILKDPRICLLIPLWEKICQTLKLDKYFIIPIRSPIDVAASLNKIHPIGLNKSYLVWLNYLFHCEKFTRERKRSFIYFPEWVNDLSKTIKKMEKDLGTVFPQNNKLNLIQVNKEFELSLVHHNNVEFKNSIIKNLCLKVFNQFKKLIDNPNDLEVFSELEVLQKEYNQISEIFLDISLESEAHIIKFNKEKAHYSAENEKLINELDIICKEKDNLNSQLKQIHSEMINLEKIQQQEKEKYIKNHENLTIELNAISREKENLLNELNSHVKKLIILNDENELFKKEKSIVNNSLKIKNKQINSVKETVIVLKKEKDLLNKEINDLIILSSKRKNMPLLRRIIAIRGKIDKELKTSMNAIRKSKLFDEIWYLTENPDVKKAKMHPIIHYIQFGAKEGRDPSPYFNTKNYILRNPNMNPQKNPLLHFVENQIKSK